MKESTVKALQELGATRWTKGSHDRLYLNQSANQIIGLEVSYYKSGNVSSARIGDTKISNACASRMLWIIKSAYIDLSTDLLVISDASERTDAGEIAPAQIIREYIDDMERAQSATSEPDSADQDTVTDTVQDIDIKIKEGDKMKEKIRENSEYILGRSELTLTETILLSAYLKAFDDWTAALDAEKAARDAYTASRDAIDRDAYEEADRAASDAKNRMIGLRHGISLAILHGDYDYWSDERPVSIDDLLSSIMLDKSIQAECREITKGFFTPDMPC